MRPLMIAISVSDCLRLRTGLRGVRRRVTLLDPAPAETAATIHQVVRLAREEAERIRVGRGQEDAATRTRSANLLRDAVPGRTDGRANTWRVTRRESAV